MEYTVEHIARLVSARSLTGPKDVAIAQLGYDSRKILSPSNTLFFALTTLHGNGHKYAEDAYAKGVRAFVVSEPIALKAASILLVDDSLAALQTLAAYHRNQFTIPVIGITGSNGKTVVKEWLAHLLDEAYHLVRSPKSFNSQIGVPLSVWQMNRQHTLGLFEAGISKPGEMERLESIIKPTIGVLTNIGEAHSEGFKNKKEKLQEKCMLFSRAEIIIGPHQLLAGKGRSTFTWGNEPDATLCIINQLKEGSDTIITANYRGEKKELRIPFTDEASVQNAVTCWCVLLYLGFDEELSAQRFQSLHPIDMRLQLLHAFNNCLLINDSYSADATSLRIALDFMQQQSAGLSRTVIISDFAETGKEAPTLYKEVVGLLSKINIDKLVAIGNEGASWLKQFFPHPERVHSFASTDDFLAAFRSSSFQKEIILLKGARRFQFERIAALFEQTLHGTVLQINLSALVHNLKAYTSILKPGTKIMAMVKAFSYGSGTAEIASVLQFHNVSYLGVAYADEGIELVKAGISLPIMVMNTELTLFDAVTEHNLQPVLYSLELLYRFESWCKEQGLAQYPVHIELETGMNRLGFALSELEELASFLGSQNTLQVQSVFSHLVGSEDPSADEFTKHQADVFHTAVTQLQQKIKYLFLTHIANSAAAVRHPHLQLDMVRLGIGLYGIEPGLEQTLALHPVATLKSTIAQIKKLEPGESVGYNRRGLVSRTSLIATVRIGYADGYSRRNGHGVGRMQVHNCTAPVVGTVCMDMTMIDVTDVPGVQEGDEVLVFGATLTLQDVAAAIDTIPYEVMTSVSQRVKRVYYYE